MAYEARTVPVADLAAYETRLRADNPKLAANIFHPEGVKIEVLIQSDGTVFGPREVIYDPQELASLKASDETREKESQEGVQATRTLKRLQKEGAIDAEFKAATSTAEENGRGRRTEASGAKGGSK